jgi:hypothetical protein
MLTRSKVGWTLLFVVAAAPAQVIRTVAVNPGPGVDYTSLPAAVAASGSGDVLLVGPGTYAPFSVSGKDLHIFGAGPGVSFIGGSTTNNAAVSVSGVPAGKKFDFAGFTVAVTMQSTVGLSSSSTAAVAISSGTVALADIAVPAPTASTNFGGHFYGLTVASAVVTAARCTFSAGWRPAVGAFFQSPATGGVGGLLSGGGAALVAHDCDFFGGSPAFVANQGGTNSGTGGVGLSVQSGSAVLTQSQCAGGDVYASSGPCIACVGSGTGGDGLLLGAGDTVRLDSSSAVGGTAYSAGPHNPGRGVVNLSTTLVALHGWSFGAPGSNPNIFFPQPAYVGAVQVGLPAFPALALTGTSVNVGELSATSPVTLSLSAPLPNAPFVVLLDLYPGLSAPLPTLMMNELLLGATFGVLFGDVLDAAGHYLLTFTPALVAPGATNSPLHLQAFVADFGNAYWRGSNQEVRVFRN